MRKGLVLGKDIIYSMNCKKTKRNNNVLVVGASGSGKTRGVVEPNILQAQGSYIITDPKGNLYEKYRYYLEAKGYRVGKINFVDPLDSKGYNPFSNIHSTQDIHKIAHMIVYGNSGKGSFGTEPFWDAAAEMLLEALIAYLWETGKEISFRSLGELLKGCDVPEGISSQKAPMDARMEKLKIGNSDSFAASQYEKFRVGASRTMKSVLITIGAALGKYDTPELRQMFQRNEIRFDRISEVKTALFVLVSDTDRSMDVLADLFFTQAMNELCRHADTNCVNSELPIGVRFIMDDFATNCRIHEFPRMIASIRSRKISVMLMIQAESQLTEFYGNDGRTIIANCDTYLYFGGNDVETATAVAKRCDEPLQEILYMPVGESRIFRRGEKPIIAEIVDLDEFMRDNRIDLWPDVAFLNFDPAELERLNQLDVI